MKTEWEKLPLFEFSSFVNRMLKRCTGLVSNQRAKAMNKIVGQRSVCDNNVFFQLLFCRKSILL